MKFFIIKLIVSSFIIATVTELARRLPTYGGIIAALPLISLLSVFWLSLQVKSNLELEKFISGVLIGFPASAFLLLIIYISLKINIPLTFSVTFGIIGWFIFLQIQNIIFKT